MSYDTRNFQRDVLQKSHKIPIVVDFWAEWCAPCRMLGPTLETLAERHAGEWKLVKLNTEEFPEIAGQYDIQGIPSVKLFVDGEVAGEFVGVLPEEQIEQWLAKSLPGKHHAQIKNARDLFAKGHTRKAQSVLKKVIAADADNHEARALLATSYIFSDAQEALKLVEGIHEASDYADTVDALRTFGHLFKLLKHADSLPERPVKTTYLQAVEKLQTKDFAGALEGLIDVLQRDRKFDDDGARKACIAIFKFIGDSHAVTKQYRPAFSSALYI